MRSGRRSPLKWVYATRRAGDFSPTSGTSPTLFRSSAGAYRRRETRFCSLIPAVPVALVGNGVDLDHFRSAGAVKRPGSIVFTGVMDYRPNIHAVEWFCHESVAGDFKPRFQKPISRSAAAARRRPWNAWQNAAA